VSVEASSSGCTWSALSYTSWARVSTTGGTGNGSVTVSVDPNAEDARSGWVSIAGKTYNIAQEKGNIDSDPGENNLEWLFNNDLVLNMDVVEGYSRSGVINNRKVKDGYLYVIQHMDHNDYVVQINLKSNPLQMKPIFTSTHQLNELLIYENTLIVTSGSGGWFFKFFDISDPANVIESNHKSLSNWPQEPLLIGQYYLSYQRDSSKNVLVEVYDISKASMFTLIDSFYIGSSQYYLSRHLFLDNDKVLSKLDNWTLMDFSDPMNIEQLGSVTLLDDLSPYTNPFVYGDYLFLNISDSSLHKIYDVSDPENPVYVKNFNFSDEMYTNECIKLSENVLLIGAKTSSPCCDSQKLFIYEMTDPTNPKLKTTVDLEFNLSISGGLVYDETLYIGLWGGPDDPGMATLTSP